MTVGRTYLDYNASAPLRPEARAAMIDALDVVGNPSSVHAEGRSARAMIEKSRQDVARLVGAAPADVIFTSGASEANATALAQDWQTVVLSALEHDSVRAAARATGARVIEVPVTRHGQFDVEAFKNLAPSVGSRALLCLQFANNETGVLQPVAEAMAVARPHGIQVLCDAVQAAGRVVIDRSALGAEFITVSAHKLGGPKGAGALISVASAHLKPLIAGGGQERGRRSGTESLIAIAGFAAAAEAARGTLETMGRIGDLRDQLEDGVRRMSPHVVVAGADGPRIANTSCLAMPGGKAELLVIRLDLAGVAISAGAACSSGKVGASPLLPAMGFAPDVARAAVRVSLGHASTVDDVTRFLDAWSEVAGKNRRAA